MNAIDILGWVATAFTLLSFTQRRIENLRALNLTGAMLWTVWGVLTVSTPVIVTNVVIVLIHTWAHVIAKVKITRKNKNK